MHSGLEVKHLLGQYRLLYTSFVKCIRYLERIKDDAMNGRSPSINGFLGGDDMSPLRTNENLKTFLARARSIIVKNKKMMSDSEGESSDTLSDHIGVTDEPKLQWKVYPALQLPRERREDEEDNSNGEERSQVWTFATYSAPSWTL
jgi:hypothetical protein